MASNELVLVTGGSGFIGSWCLLYTLQRGYRARTTVRSLKRADEVRQMLLNGGATQEQADSVEFVAADLTDDKGWKEACEGATYVLHVASPFPMGVPKNEDDLIIPARDGTMRALKAAKAAGVKRVVVTSSSAAVAYGHPPRDEPFTEKDWTDLNGPNVPAYQKSKTIAERAAWDYVEKEGAGMEMATVNPVGVLGPVLSKSAGTSVEIVVRMMNGGMPFLPKLYVGWVDVRDVAELHLVAMASPMAKGERFVAYSGGDTLKGIASILKSKLGDKAKKVSTREVPNFVIKLAAYVDPSAALVAGELDKVKKNTSEKAKSVLGWQARSVEEATVATAESAIKYGLITV